jgi:orotate phosphoribosyltransferase
MVTVAKYEDTRQSLLRGLYSNGMLRTWFRDQADGWTLVSGLWSPFYLNLRDLCSFPELLRLAGALLADVVKAEIPEASRLVGIAFGGIPLAVATSLASDIPAAMTRKLPGVQTVDQMESELGRWGQHSLVEGRFHEADTIVLVDDLVTRFDSKLIAFSQVAAEMRKRRIDTFSCHDVAVVIDREQGAAAAARANGFRLHAVLKFRSELPILRGALDPLEYDVISRYLEDPAPFQDRRVQADLAREASPAAIPGSQ